MSDNLIEKLKKKKKKKKTLCFQLDEDLLKAFDDYAKEQDLKKVTIIDALLRDLLVERL